MNKLNKMKKKKKRITEIELHFPFSIQMTGREQLTYLARLRIFTDNNIIFPGKFRWIVIDIQNSNTHCDMAQQTRIVCKTHRDVFSISMHTLEVWF